MFCIWHPLTPSHIYVCWTLNYSNVWLWFGWLETNLLQRTHISIQSCLYLSSFWGPSVGAIFPFPALGTQVRSWGLRTLALHQPVATCRRWWLPPAPLTAGQIFCLTAAFWSPAWKNNLSWNWAQNMDFYTHGFWIKLFHLTAFREVSYQDVGLLAFAVTICHSTLKLKNTKISIHISTMYSLIDCRSISDYKLHVLCKEINFKFGAHTESLTL